MSKAFSLPGLRVGWIVDPDASRWQRIVDARSYLTISSSPLLEALATHALLNRTALLSMLASVATVNLAELDAMMSRQAEHLGWIRPEGGTTAFPWFGNGRDTRPFCRQLAKAGVLVVPGDCFGMPEHVRIGFAAKAEGFATQFPYLSENWSTTTADRSGSAVPRSKIQVVDCNRPSETKGLHDFALVLF